MRVLCSSTSGFGHWMPLVPVARALEAAGHEVRFACPESGAPDIVARGFAVDPFDDAPGPSPEQQELFQRAEETGDVGLIEQAVLLGFALVYPAAAMARLSASMDGYAPDLVVRDPAEFASRILAQRHGIPSVAAMGGLQGSLAHLFTSLTEALDTLRAQHGVATGGDALDDALVLTATPESFDTPGSPDAAPVARYRLDVPRGRPPDDDPPLVYATVGTEVFRQGGRLGRDLVTRIGNAVATLPVRCLLTLGLRPTGDGLSLPGNVVVEEFVDHGEVVPRASVVVTHGGAGTVQDALLMGRPLVVLPQFADQFANAARVDEVGVGVGLTGDAQAPDAIADAIGRALDGEFDYAVRRIADESASLPTLPDRVTELQDLAGAA